MQASDAIFARRGVGLLSVIFVSHARRVPSAYGYNMNRQPAAPCRSRPEALANQGRSAPAAV